MLLIKKIYLTLAFLICFFKKQNNLALKICQKLIEKSYFIPKKRILNYDSMICNIGTNIILSNNSFISDGFSEKELYKPEPNKLLVLNSEIYDMGGHTEAILHFVETFKNEYCIDFLITSLYNSSKALAPVKLQHFLASSRWTG